MKRYKYGVIIDCDDAHKIRELERAATIPPNAGAEGRREPRPTKPDA